MNNVNVLSGILLRPGVINRARSSPGINVPFIYQGYITAEAIGPDGTVKSRGTSRNAAVTYGMDRLANFIAAVTGAASNWMNYLAIGTGTTAPTSTDASLVASTGSGAAVKIYQGVRTARYTFAFASNNPAGAATIAEAGLFQTDTFTGSMGARGTLSPVVTKGASDSLNLTYDVVVQGT